MSDPKDIVYVPTFDPYYLEDFPTAERLNKTDMSAVQAEPSLGQRWPEVLVVKTPADSPEFREALKRLQEVRSTSRAILIDSEAEEGLAFAMSEVERTGSGYPPAPHIDDEPDAVPIDVGSFSCDDMVDALRYAYNRQQDHEPLVSPSVWTFAEKMSKRLTRAAADDSLERARARVAIAEGTLGKPPESAKTPARSYDPEQIKIMFGDTELTGFIDAVFDSGALDPAPTNFSCSWTGTLRDKGLQEFAHRLWPRRMTARRRAIRQAAAKRKRTRGWK